MINLAMFKPLWGFCRKHATKLLCGLAIGSEAAALYLTAKEAPEVKKKLDELPPDATKMDKFKVGAKGYAPAGAAAFVSMASMIVGTMIGEHQKAVLSAAGAAAQIAAAKYQQALEKHAGKDAVKDVEQDIAKECVTDKKTIQPLQVIATGKGDDLFYDPLSGRLFTSSRAEIEKAMIRINKKIFNSIWMSVNEWYEELNISDIVLAVDKGWNVDNMMDIGFQPQMTDDGRACLAICYYNRPIRYK